MAGADAVVRARIDRATLGGRALPFEVKVPDPETVAALHDSRNGAVTRFTSVDDLFADTDD